MDPMCFLCHLLSFRYSLPSCSFYLLQFQTFTKPYCFMCFAHPYIRLTHIYHKSSTHRHVYNLNVHTFSIRSTSIHNEASYFWCWLLLSLLLFLLLLPLQFSFVLLLSTGFFSSSLVSVRCVHVCSVRFLSHFNFCNYNIVFACTRLTYDCITGWRIISLFLFTVASMHFVWPYLSMKLHAYKSIRANIANSTDSRCDAMRYECIWSSY